MKLKKLIRKYYKAYLERNKGVAEELLDPNFQALSSMMKFYSAQDYLEGGWKQTNALVGLDYELEVVDEDNSTAFYVLKWDFGDSTMHTAEYIEVKNEKIIKILWINMGPKFYTELVEK